MKKILILILFFAAYNAEAQVQFLGTPKTTIHTRGKLQVDSVLRIPARDTNYIPTRIGEIVMRPADSSFYGAVSLVALKKWQKIGSGGAGGSQSLQQVTDIGNTTTATIYAGNFITQVGGVNTAYLTNVSNAGAVTLKGLDSTWTVNIYAPLLSANRFQYLPNKDGTFAMISDIPAAVDVTGKQNYTDTSTTDATRFWVQGRGYLTADSLSSAIYYSPIGRRDSTGADGKPIVIVELISGAVTNEYLATGIDPAKIAQTASYRFVTDAEKTTWNTGNIAGLTADRIPIASSATGLVDNNNFKVDATKINLLLGASENNHSIKLNTLAAADVGALQWTNTDLYLRNNTATGNLSLGTNASNDRLIIKSSGEVLMPERVAPATPAVGFTSIYPKADGLWYGKDDAGVETQLSNVAGGTGNVTKVGTPVANQVGVWTGDGTLGTVTGLTQSSTIFAVPTELNVSAARVAQYNPAARFFVPALSATTDDAAEFQLGKEAAINNAGVVGMQYYAAGSTTNELYLGFWGGGKKMQINAAGQVTFDGLNDATGVAKMVTTTNGVLGYQAVPTAGTGDVTQTANSGSAGRLKVSAGLNKTIQDYATAGIVKSDASGVASAAIAGTDYVIPSGSITGTAANVTGTVAVANGGTGATTLTGVVIGTGTTAATAVAGTANQELRRNAGNTAYEFFTPTPIKMQMDRVWELPTATDQFSLAAKIPNAITITNAEVIIRGTTPSVTYTISYGTTLGTAIGTIVASNTVTTPGTATINVSAIPAGNYIWVSTTAASGTIPSFGVFLYYTQN